MAKHVSTAAGGLGVAKKNVKEKERINIISYHIKYFDKL